MDIVVNTRLRLEASWLPEFTSVMSSVIVIKEILTDPADGEKTNSVCLAASIEGVQIALMLVVAFVVEHFDHAIV